MSHSKAFQIAHITLLSLLLPAGLATFVLAMVSTYLLKYGDWTAIFSLLTINGLLLLLASIYYLIMITTRLGRDNHPMASVGVEGVVWVVGWGLSLATTIKIATYGRWDDCDGLCLSEIIGITLSSASLFEVSSSPQSRASSLPTEVQSLISVLTSNTSIHKPNNQITLLLLTLFLFTRSHRKSPISHSGSGSGSGSVWRDNTRSHLERSMGGGFGQLGRKGMGSGSQVDLRETGEEGYRA